MSKREFFARVQDLPFVLLGTTKYDPLECHTAATENSDLQEREGSVPTRVVGDVLHTPDRLQVSVLR